MNTLRTVQEVGVELFETDGFDQTPVETIATAAGVSASTIYRLFGTKESIVTWDEADAVIEHELEKRLGREPSVAAFKNAVVAAWTEREDMELFARRLRLMFEEPSIGAAAVEADLRDRAELADAFAEADGRKKATVGDDVTAGVCLAALEAATDHWQRAPDTQDLGDLLHQAFDAVNNLSS